MSASLVGSEMCIRDRLHRARGDDARRRGDDVALLAVAVADPNALGPARGRLPQAGDVVDLIVDLLAELRQGPVELLPGGGVPARHAISSRHAAAHQEARAADGP
eukprot:7114794-Alexandrium_andersonii.AAC.1